MNNWRDRAAALIEFVSDITGETPPPPRPSWPKPHLSLFEQYVADLRRARQEAQTWWNGMISAVRQRGGDQEEAARFVKRRFPVGAVCAKRVIGVVRHYWLACAALNAAAAPADRVPPEQFLLGRLIGTRDQDLAEFVSALPYWPIGMDADGNWV